ncbi:TPA: hypothetical protein ACGCDJ_003709, partial [Vibrio cholerae]
CGSCGSFSDILVNEMDKNRPLSIEKQQTIFFLDFHVDDYHEKPFNTPRRPDSSVGRAED